ncbi:hypothetical protein WDZ11_11500 [Roseomonas mucosa]|uniref:hypothetical protein n=1 Tax=Roseomonas mucosa TaxID=207340 RepID=UPI0030CC3607
MAQYVFVNLDERWQRAALQVRARDCRLTAICTASHSTLREFWSGVADAVVTMDSLDDQSVVTALRSLHAANAIAAVITDQDAALSHVVGLEQRLQAAPCSQGRQPEDVVQGRPGKVGVRRDFRYPVPTAAPVFLPKDIPRIGSSRANALVSR